jgi:hypothetical protein
LLEPPAKKKEEDGLFTFFIPAMQKVRQAQTRLDLRIALLRHAEALRLYAAEHNNELPKSLSDVPVPLPPDPFTGKPVRYSLEGATAHLRGGLPDGVQTDRPDLHLHFVVTLQK